MDFSENSVFKLKKISISDVNQNVIKLLLPGEEIVSVYKTVRDQVVFTDKRIIPIYVQGITGAKQEIFSLPYSKVIYFGIQTPALVEWNIKDAELALFFANKMKVVFEFKGDSDILEIGRVLSRYVL